ncbi:MAG: VOC family protein [Candidatus Riflebacteria bacterium]|nr:VOC family protein [Candidatus Riflebacteria bacterium]
MLKRFIAVMLVFYFLASPVSGQDSDEKSQPDSYSFSHVALAVKDLNEAIEWYKNVLGFKLAQEPVEIDTETSPLGEVACNLFGKNMKKLRIAQMETGDQFGIELFEFVLPKPEKSKNDENKTAGILHICVNTENVEALIEKIEKNGGKLRIKHFPPNSQKKLAFCEDKDGNLIEISNNNWTKKVNK